MLKLLKKVHVNGKNGEHTKGQLNPREPAVKMITTVVLIMIIQNTPTPVLDYIRVYSYKLQLDKME